MRVGYLWSGDERWHNHTLVPGRMHMNVLPTLLGYDVLHWEERAQWAGDYDLVIVQHFTRNYSVLEPVREKFLGARLAMRPDRPPEWEARRRSEVFGWLMHDLMLADVVLDAMPDGRRASFYAQMVSKPVSLLPSPIVPHPDVVELRKRSRRGVVGWLHPADEAHRWPTLATLAALQRLTGTDVTVINAVARDKQVAQQLGLVAAFETAPGHEGFIDLLSQAELLIDLFPMHTPHRVATVAAYLGTPTVTGRDTPDVGHVRVDAWSGDGVIAALELLAPDRREAAVQAGIYHVEKTHMPDAIRQAVEALVDEKVIA